MIKIRFVVGLGLLLCSWSAHATVNVFACEPEWAALVNALGGKHVDSFAATTAFQDAHYVEARPSLIAKARRADLLVCTGADLEVGWLPLILRQSGNAAIQQHKAGYFMAAEQVTLMDKPSKIDRSQGDVHAAGNPHVHWDPYRMLTIAKALSTRLVSIDPQHATDYQANLLNFESKWRRHIKAWEAQAQVLKGKKVIVYHKHWNYLNHWLGIKAVGDLEPKPGIPPTSAHLASLLQTVRATGADAILVNTFQNDKGAHWLSSKTQVPVVHLPYTVGGSQTAIDLVSLYSEVINQLVRDVQ